MIFPGRRGPFVPPSKRRPFRWPNGARLAIWVVPNIEYFDPDTLGGSVLATPAAHVPDVPNWTWRDYGNRVGVWRTMEILSALEIPATVALNAEICVAYPEIVDAGLALGWEFMAHGRANNEPLNGMAEAQERNLISATVTTIEKATGVRVHGWLGPGLAENDRTLDILAEIGIGYVGDWLSDEDPIELSTSQGTIWSMPYSLESNDIGPFLRRNYTAPDYGLMLQDQFDVLYEEAASTGKIMCVATHPFITGVPFRSKYLAAALRHMRSREDVWFATGSEILSAYRTAQSAV